MTFSPLLAHFGPLLYPAALAISSVILPVTVKVFLKGGRVTEPEPETAPSSSPTILDLPALPPPVLKPEETVFSSDRRKSHQSSC